MPQVTVFSPAKVNLHLAIGLLREDGYHNATSIMQTLTLHDTLVVRCNPRSPGAGLSVNVVTDVFEGVAELDIPSESNIAHKAVVRLAQVMGRAVDEHVEITIEKHIPHAAGLGGGSSNAAAALLAACRLWGIDPQAPEVLAVAAELGADVPFFLYGGCALLGERGDAFKRTLAPLRGTVVLVRPDEGVSTAAAYRAFDRLQEALHGEGSCECEASATEGVSPQALAFACEVAADEAVCASQVEVVQAAEDLSLFNNLAPASVAVLPELERVHTWLAAQPGVARDARTGRPRVLLSGSGSATFALIEGPDPARAACGIVSAAKLEGWWARSCSFAPMGARIIEGRRLAGSTSPYAKYR